MNLPFRIARRYLFARKSANAINVISGISVGGIAIGTAALILILSVFNGFEDLIASLFSTFNPEIKITAEKGKSFEADSLMLTNLRDLEGVKAVSATLEEIAYFEYRDIQDFGYIKGVDDQFTRVVPIDSAIVEGRFETIHQGRAQAILGIGLRHKLAVNIYDEFEPLRVYMPKRGGSYGMGKPYTSKLLPPVGTFYIQQNFNNEYVLSNLSFVQSLLDKKGEISALEVSLEENADLAVCKERIRNILGERFEVKDRFEQDAATIRIMRLEKWLAFAILGFTLVLVAFNLIGALWMIVIDKKQDIAILKAMGATGKTIRHIFLWEGMLLCGLGMLIGFVLALLFYVAQKQFGLIAIPEGFIIDAYPISLKAGDFLAVASLVVAIGLLASLPAALRAAKVPALIREE